MVRFATWPTCYKACGLKGSPLIQGNHRRLLALHSRPVIQRQRLHLFSTGRPHRHDILLRPRGPSNLPPPLAHRRLGRILPPDRRLQSSLDAPSRVARSILHPVPGQDPRARERQLNRQVPDRDRVPRAGGGIRRSEVDKGAVEQ